jgi:hypothetical protein
MCAGLHVNHLYVPATAHNGDTLLMCTRPGCGVTKNLTKAKEARDYYDDARTEGAVRNSLSRLVSAAFGL